MRGVGEAEPRRSPGGPLREIEQPSGDMGQRAEPAAALVAGLELLLPDEPTAGREAM
ncbi:hypothetical protein GCM10010269_54430 [Streptomyces humidus]|uniref:Uncharacterized protein n=1 Tax=Streptomyces humidus TaxID=52259 RepID=A0A918L5E5_9ACTN|nr:hypothetical protein GCM10010269_54430 [Streptomyces humidus]